MILDNRLCVLHDHHSNTRSDDGHNDGRLGLFFLSFSFSNTVLMILDNRLCVHHHHHSNTPCNNSHDDSHLRSITIFITVTIYNSDFDDHLDASKHQNEDEPPPPGHDDSHQPLQQRRQGARDDRGSRRRRKFFFKKIYIHSTNNCLQVHVCVHHYRGTTRGGDGHQKKKHDFRARCICRHIP
jgi:hypothetical protein